MTRSTHIASPEPAEVRALLDAAGWSAYEAARRIGLSARAVQAAASGERRMHGALWRLLRLHAVQADRDALPPAPIQSGG